MSARQHIYSYIQFNLNQITIAANDNEMFAATDGSDNILVWQVLGKNSKCISMIISPVEVKDIKWVYGSESLAILGTKRCYIWDIKNNKSIKKIDLIKKINFIALEDDKFIFLADDGEIQIISGKKIEKVHTKLCWYKDNKLSFYEDEGNLIRNLLSKLEHTTTSLDENVGRKFKKQNKFKINYPILAISDTEKVPDLKIPLQLQKYFTKIDILTVHITKICIIYQTNLGVTIIKRGRKPEFAHLRITNCIILTDHKNNSVHNFGDTIINNKGVISRRLINEIRINPPLFVNAPDYIFDQRNSYEYTHLSNNSGFMILVNDEVLRIHDLFNNESREIHLDEIKRYTRILIDEERKHLLGWNFGAAPPRGRLKLYDLTSNEVHLIYDVKKINSVNSDKFLKKNSELINGNLLIPGWHSVELTLLHQKKSKGKTTLSLSQLYFLIQNLSKSEFAADLNYNHEAKGNTIAYGDLQLGDRRYDAIFPLWDKSAELLITMGIDGNCYIWELGSIIPIYSFPITIPVKIKILDDIVAIISFSCKKQSFKGRNHEELKTLFPLIELSVFNRSKMKHQRKSIPFPTHLTKVKLGIDIDGEGVEFTIPSYIDKKERMIYTHFNDKFSKINPSDHKRFWVTNTTNTNLMQKKIGVEYPFDPHPEIRRDLHFRPFVIYNYELVRRSDDLTIINGLQHLYHEQISSDNTLTADKTISIDLPFTGDRLIETYISNKHKISPEKLNLLDSISNPPRFIKHTRNELDNRRGRVLIDRINKEKIKFNNNGIIFDHY